MPWTDPPTATPGQVISSSMIWNTGARDNLRVTRHVLNADMGTVDVASTAGETTVASFTVTGEFIAVPGCADLRLGGDYLFNNNTGDTLTVRTKLAGVTIATQTFSSGQLGGATRREWEQVVRVINLTSASVNRLTSRLLYNNIAQGTVVSVLNGAATTQNTASDFTLAVTVQWSASSANDSWRKYWAVLEAANYT